MHPFLHAIINHAVDPSIALLTVPSVLAIREYASYQVLFTFIPLLLSKLDLAKQRQGS